MKRITLHIGTDKTGTSAIQAALARSHDVMKAHGVLYPEHHSFASARAGRVTTGNVEWKETWFEDQVIRAVCNNPSYAAYIFSAEYLYWKMNGFIETHTKYLSEYDFDVVLVVRNPFEMLNSRYIQHVKGGGYFLSIQDFAPLATSFRNAVKAARELEARNIRYTLFNYSAIKRDIVQRFFTHVGLWDIVKPDASKVHSVNRSLTAAELNFLRYMNQIFGKDYASRISNELLFRLPNIIGDVLPIDEETRREVCAMNEEGVRFFNERLPKSEQLTLEPLQPTVKPGSDHVLSDEQIEVIKDVLFRTLETQKHTAKDLAKA